MKPMVRHSYGTSWGGRAPPLTAPHLPEPQLAAPTALMGVLSGSSGGGCVIPFCDHPSRDCVCHLNACPDSGWPRGREEHHEHTYHKKPTSWRGTPGKQKEPAIPEWRAVPKSKEYPSEPTAPWTDAEEDSSSLGNINPLTKNILLGDLRTRLLILRTRVQLLQ